MLWSLTGPKDWGSESGATSWYSFNSTIAIGKFIFIICSVFFSMMSNLYRPRLKTCVDWFTNWKFSLVALLMLYELWLRWRYFLVPGSYWCGPINLAVGPSFPYSGRNYTFNIHIFITYDESLSTELFCLNSLLTYVPPTDCLNKQTFSAR